MIKLTYTAAGILLVLTVTPTFAQQGNPYSSSNNPYAAQNNPYSYQNNPFNPDNSQFGGKNAIYDDDGNYTGYAVPKSDGSGVNIFSPDGDRTGYTDKE